MLNQEFKWKYIKKIKQINIKNDQLKHHFFMIYD